MRNILAALAAGLVVFVWGTISWMALPFHNMTMKSFENEAVVSSALKANATDNAVYIIPYGGQHADGLSKEEKEQAWKAANENMKKGPFAFMVVYPNGKDSSMGLPMLLGFVKDVIAAFLLIGLLGLCAQNLNFWQKVGFVVIAMLAGGIVCYLPLWIWWGFTPGYIGVAFLDLVVSWLLAGLVIAKLT